MAKDSVEIAVVPKWASLDLDTSTVRPGNKLIIRYSGTISIDFVDEVTSELRSRLPGVEIVIVQADQILVYRDGDSATEGGLAG